MHLYIVKNAETLIISLPESLGDMTDFGYKFRYCYMINRITQENGELRKQE
jgi:hypothetical protein